MPKHSTIFHSHRCGGGCGKQNFGCSKTVCRYADWIVCPDCVEKERKQWMSQVSDEKQKFDLSGQSFHFPNFRQAVETADFDELSKKTNFSVDFFTDLEHCHERLIEPMPSDLKKIADVLSVSVESFYQQSSLF